MEGSSGYNEERRVAVILNLYLYIVIDYYMGPEILLYYANYIGIINLPNRREWNLRKKLAHYTYDKNYAN